jgi:type IV pilus assembly protein PilN
MRLNINVATQPYQDVRRFLFRWGLAVVIVALLTFGLVYAAVSATLNWRTLTKRENELRAQIAERDRIRANAESFLNQKQNRATRDQSQFLNSLIARKAFSWTDVLSDLERIMPGGIQVVGIRPQINDNNQLELRLTVAGQSRDSAIELVRRLEGSQHFRYAEMVNESSQENKGQGPALQFEISAIYVPSWETNGRAVQGGQ